MSDHNFIADAPVNQLAYEFHTQRWDYSVHGHSRLLVLTNQELIGFKNNLPSLLKRVERHVSRYIVPVFFRLSSRSAKDLGTSGLIANSFDDVINAFHKSERIQKDIQLHLDSDTGYNLYLVLDTAKQFIQKARCFVYNSTIIAACTYDDEECERIPGSIFMQSDEMVTILKVYKNYKHVYCIDFGLTETAFSMDRYAWDVIDVNLVNIHTDSCVFTLNELQQLAAVSISRTHAMDLSGIHNDEFGSRFWITHGRPHRENKPAIEHDSGIREWCWHGKYHRRDGPAISCDTGCAIQLIDRDTSTVEYVLHQWRCHGKRHRIGGPSTERKNGLTEWCLNGFSYSKEEYNEKIFLLRRQCSRMKMVAILSLVVHNKQFVEWFHAPGNLGHQWDMADLKHCMGIRE